MILTFFLIISPVSVDCMAGPWALWSPCTRNGQNCGYRYGMITRTREVLESPSPNGVRCPSLIETRCCLMEMRRCVGEWFIMLISVLNDSMKAQLGITCISCRNYFKSEIHVKREREFHVKITLTQK